MNIPWSVLQAESARRECPVSQVLALWGMLLSHFFYKFRCSIFRLNVVHKPVASLMEQIDDQVEKLEVCLATLSRGAESKAKLSPFVQLKLHAEMCRLRQLCFACFPVEHAIIKAERHLNLLQEAQMQLLVSRGSKTAQRKKQRAAAEQRAAARAAAQSPANSAGSDVLVCLPRSRSRLCSLIPPCSSRGRAQSVVNAGWRGE